MWPPSSNHLTALVATPAGGRPSPVSPVHTIQSPPSGGQAGAAQPWVELHTGALRADAAWAQQPCNSLACQRGHVISGPSSGLRVNAGHGSTYQNWSRSRHRGNREFEHRPHDRWLAPGRRPGKKR